MYIFIHQGYEILWILWIHKITPSKEHSLMLFRIHLELLLAQHYMVVQTLLFLHTQPLVMVCMCMYAMHVLNSMNNHNGSNILYFKKWFL